MKALAWAFLAAVCFAGNMLGDTHAISLQAAYEWTWFAVIWTVGTVWYLITERPS